MGVIAGYTDGYATTAPVMCFEPNKLELYDLGGNVWEWCEDLYNQAKTERVSRGGSWATAERVSLLSSSRGHREPGQRLDMQGFRIVIEMTNP